ncbi:WhiB family transcriptional regulator [Mycobacterium sp. MUNTM1]
MRTRVGLRWQKRSVCGLETPDVPDLWTPDHAPAQAVRVHLEQMCRRCPVLRKCAEDAVLTQAQSGFYAGVFVPEHQATGWAGAMDQLCAIAGLDSTAADAVAMGASA